MSVHAGSLFVSRGFVSSAPGLAAESGRARHGSRIACTKPDDSKHSLDTNRHEPTRSSLVCLSTNPLLPSLWELETEICSRLFGFRSVMFELCPWPKPNKVKQQLCDAIQRVPPSSIGSGSWSGPRTNTQAGFGILPAVPGRRATSHDWFPMG